MYSSDRTGSVIVPPVFVHRVRLVGGAGVREPSPSSADPVSELTRGLVNLIGLAPTRVHVASTGTAGAVLLDEPSPSVMGIGYDRFDAPILRLSKHQVSVNVCYSDFCLKALVYKAAPGESVENAMKRFGTWSFRDIVRADVGLREEPHEILTFDFRQVSASLEEARSLGIDTREFMVTCIIASALNQSLGPEYASVVLGIKVAILDIDASRYKGGMRPVLVHRRPGNMA